MPEPILIAHRGASGARPEHTLAAYELAARLGADYLEPDLVATADGHLVARHENEISTTTDIADHPEFADRATSKVIDGHTVTGWFTEDLTLAELRTLRCRERLPDLRPGNTAYDGQFTVPTLEEILDLRARLSAELGRDLGVYPETKHPTHFRDIGLPLDEPLVAVLERAGLNEDGAPVFLQSFELGNLIHLRRDLGARAPLVFLAEAAGAPYDFVAAQDPRTFADLLTPAGLAELARWVDGIGPHKDLVIAPGADGTLGEPTSLVTDAHEARLVVHPWTFRRENAFLPTDLRGAGGDPGAAGDVVAEIRAHLAAGVDGFFTDHTDLGVQARAQAQPGSG
ncbi:glycerophosphodiester phosphodiesterase [Ornithinimicrobium faecis]|uniref:glycerophosphodiester phosphodiesterase n=1 Tax=Ornithinimicrobium faecis TaxID=2934158 RepID=A0ABY4YP16_9MICO|nr:glycerophosphodiester phosphodiesterase [Ornithinimicrobium sp. HY1793]USQ78434.1 glycerophosphodiester phosphodiesterase [Ornithinimicrobium sp. HY1793]